ncbi:MAG TPA: hypothetical protein VFS40_08095 [Gemmatimonadales bacterium]|nr:hypothetical protein [Gemmatimonadales bacterium]
MWTIGVGAGLMGIALGAASAPLAALAAQQRDTVGLGEAVLEARVRGMRSGIGAVAGSWRVQDDTVPAGGNASGFPLIEASYAHGLDLHLALEQSVVFWRRRERRPADAVTGLAASEVTSYVVTQLTSLRAFPFTRPTAALEPFLRGSAGFALGIAERIDAPGTAAEASTTDFVPGIALAGGAGLAWHVSRAFDLTAGASYRWQHFFEDGLGGRRSWRGIDVGGGVGYHFQFH